MENSKSPSRWESGYLDNPQFTNALHSHIMVAFLEFVLQTHRRSLLLLYLLTYKHYKPTHYISGTICYYSNIPDICQLESRAQFNNFYYYTTAQTTAINFHGTWTQVIFRTLCNVAKGAINQPRQWVNRDACQYLFVLSSHPVADACMSSFQVFKVAPRSLLERKTLSWFST